MFSVFISKNIGDNIQIFSYKILLLSGQQMTERRSQRGSISNAASSAGMIHSHMLRKAEALWCVSSVGRFVANDK
jgi:hypothetical protein